MAVEIERKFLVKGDFKSAAKSRTYILQGYLASNSDCTVRIRLRDNQGYLTIKGKSCAQGLSRYEFEKQVSKTEALELLSLCTTPKIEKYRWLVPSGQHTIEVDEFLGDNAGLIMAEVELASTQDDFIRPSFLGKEVTGDKRFYNSNLRLHPFKEWANQE